MDEISVKENKIIEAIDDNSLDIINKTSDNLLNNSDFIQESVITNRKEILEESSLLLKKKEERLNNKNEKVSNSILSSEKKTKNWDDIYDD